MSKSHDIIITLKNIDTNKEYKPTTRTSTGFSVIKVPEGNYKIEKLIMRETQFTKCFCSIPGTDKFVYGFSDRDCRNLNTSGFIGNLQNGGLLLGEKYILVEKNYLNYFQIKNNVVYEADSLILRGKIESLFKDLPNLEITQSTSKENTISFFNKDFIEFKRE
tara:strand:+ start:49 stop:537 length:489 start_codon:yes stop_codon:yes gene_type:complete